MEKQGFLYLLLGLALGSIVTSTMLLRAPEASRNAYNAGLRMNKEHAEKNIDHEMSMGGMTEMLEGKAGDDYDKAFLEMMILHHEGAIEMAKLSEKSAKHDEIKTLSRAILEAQEGEIRQMIEWHNAWGYGQEEIMPGGMKY